MALYARVFFMNRLGLPFTDAAVVGNTYYATPVSGAPLRLRIDFARTITAGEYDGLRLAVIHQDRGELDAVALRFEDHRTFDHRDATLGRSPRESEFGTMREFRDRPEWVPWEGAHTDGLRDAVEQYSSVWFPGAWTASAPGRGAGRTTHKTPSPPPTRGGGARTR
ncbi:hypothetical protein SUDANB105_00704 [Streptomyces sp. enrichment culture]|uniref:hypothetical protein n=1 Tax=Streptomyces sp. enrichment culture TaxID=1795815 RepID=UPI003F574508